MAWGILRLTIVFSLRSKQRCVTPEGSPLSASHLGDLAMSRWMLPGVLMVGLVLLTSNWPSRSQEGKMPSRAELIQTAVIELVKMQEEGGQWPYEGVYRVSGNLPVGYR